MSCLELFIISLSHFLLFIMDVEHKFSKSLLAVVFWPFLNWVESGAPDTVGHHNPVACSWQLSLPAESALLGGRKQEELCACLPLPHPLLVVQACLLLLWKCPNAPSNRYLFSCENQKTMLHWALQDRKWMLGLVWYAPSPLWQPPVGLAQTEAPASVLSIYFDIKHGSAIKNDSACRIGFLTGPHFALGNDSLTCHPPFFPYLYSGAFLFMTF